MTVHEDADDQNYDATGMGSHEQDLQDSPFSNDLVATDVYEDDPATTELNAEVTAITNPNPIDLATGDSRLNLRGFPRPRLRDGFAQTGIPGILNVNKLLVIQGPLVPVYGRAAPGGIEDYLTSRPRTKALRRLAVTLNTGGGQHGSDLVGEFTGPAVPKRFWQRLAFEQRLQDGPADFAHQQYQTFSGAFTWKHSRTASTLVAIDLLGLRGNIAPGIPQYRTSSGGRIVGPYLPLASFNTYGPNSGVERSEGCVTIQFDGQPNPRWSLRAAVQAWKRRVVQDRFTSGVLRLDTGLFDGTREPFHLWQDQDILATQLESTRRFSALGAEHKLMLAYDTTFSDYQPEQRGLPTDARNALADSVRFFNPWAPDFSRPAYSPEIYSRIITDRSERTTYQGLELSERAAFLGGRLVATAGLRQDWVTLDLADRKPGAAHPKVGDSVRQLSRLLGLNYQLLPNRLIAFADTSTAFDPSTRVDARTGRIRGNQTTLGYEGGVKGRWFANRLALTATGFAYYNRGISTKNPLYDNPVTDPNQTQPELVAAGEQRFTGAKLDATLRLTPEFGAIVRASRTRAVTTSSPDLPDQVGRPVTRMPSDSLTLSLRYGGRQGRWNGVSAGASLAYVGPYAATYRDAVHEELDYPGYTLAAFNLGYSWSLSGITHSVGVSVQNALNANLLASQARLGADRSLRFSYRLTL